MVLVPERSGSLCCKTGVTFCAHITAVRAVLSTAINLIGGPLEHQLQRETELPLAARAGNLGVSVQHPDRQVRIAGR